MDSDPAALLGSCSLASMSSPIISIGGDHPRRRDLFDRVAGAEPGYHDPKLSERDHLADLFSVATGYSRIGRWPVSRGCQPGRRLQPKSTVPQLPPSRFQRRFDERNKN